MEFYSRFTPLGLGYINALLRSHGYDSRILNCSAWSWKRTERFLRQERPDILGVSVFTFNRHEAMRLAGLARKAVPSCFIVAGGPHATHLPHHLLSRYPQVDVVARGEGEETMLDLVRAREDAKKAERVARHQLSKFLLRNGRRYPGKTTWNREHRRWITAQPFEHPATELALVDLLAAVDGLTARRDALDERLSRLAQDPRLWPTVARLRAFRGIDTLTALTVHLELGGDWHRFGSAPKLSSWLGLTPSLKQSGEQATQGSISKTGSSIARRLLVEAAWHYLRTPAIDAGGQKAPRDRLLASNRR
jgi:hypothetical protein